MRTQITYRLFFASFLLLAACGPTNVLVFGQYPEPLAEKIPLNAGVFYDQNFRQYIHTDEAGQGLNVDIGNSQTLLFNEVFNKLFNSATVLDSIERGQGNEFDLTIAPHVEEIQVALPRDTLLSVFEFWIKYNIQVFDHQGEPIADWIMTSYGKTVESSDSKESAINQAAVVALRDTGAQLVTKFHRTPGIKEWLEERLAQTTAGETDE